MEHLDRPAKVSQILWHLLISLKFFPIDKQPSLADVQEGILWLDEPEDQQADVILPVFIDGQEHRLLATFNFSSNGDGLRMSSIITDHPNKGKKRTFTIQTERMDASEEVTKEETAVPTTAHEEQKQL